MRLIQEALRIIANNRAAEENRRRGRDDLRLREVEALEKLAERGLESSREGGR